MIFVVTDIKITNKHIARLEALLVFTVQLHRQDIGKKLLNKELTFMKEISTDLWKNTEGPLLQWILRYN